MTPVVIGGGIGGLTAAVALQQRGIDAHVYEAAPELGRVGKGIWLPTNAMLVLDRLGLGDALAARGVALERVEVHDAASGLLQRIDLAAVRARLGRTTTSILRADLQAVLAAALEPGSLHLGKRFRAVRQDDRGVTALFEDGSEVRADVAIGADGLRSRVREAVAPEARLRYAGQTCWLGIADLALPAAQLRTVKELWGGAARFGYSAVAADRVYWFAPVAAPTDAPLPDDVLGRLRERYRGFPSPVPEILERTPENDPIRVELHDLAPLARWHRGRVALLGDAAHAMTPNLGQGGAQAIEDAWVLARTLAEEGTPDAAFRAYELLRRPKAVRLTRTAWWYGKAAHVRAPWLRGLRNLAARAVPERVNQRQGERLYRLEF